MAEPPASVGGPAENYPAVLTDGELLSLGSGFTLEGKAKFLFDPDAVEAVEKPATAKQNTVAQILIVSDPIVSYKKTGDNQWTRLRAPRKTSQALA